ncbi:MAG: aminomethyl-transferring glycine dehydrogenase [Deltaproteobacteria bacterium]|nr:aminomethyl-transferring glycine dehydrogenase [Deltaproteobacteria bacterium]
MPNPSLVLSLESSSTFADRHIGPNKNDTQIMLKRLGFSSLEELVQRAIPDSIQIKKKLSLPEALDEILALKELKEIATQNQVYRSFIGMGYSDCVIPGVISRNIFENPGWYTQYTPYQAEISQGRLEALLNFQTLITDLTGLEISNASLLDEGTAAAEAMSLCWGQKNNESVNKFFVSSTVHPQTLAVISQRAEPIGIEVVVADPSKHQWSAEFFGGVVQYPDTEGTITDYTAFIEEAHSHGALVIMAADLLSLVLLKTPGEMGADVAIGNTQRFGVPLGFGGPHAAYMATRLSYQRRLPGRIVGVSKDRDGNPAMRLTLQTREQHIRRDKATSNICTAQVLLAVMAGMYGVYHGPEGLTKIAIRIHSLTALLQGALKRAGLKVSELAFFDTLVVSFSKEEQQKVLKRSQEAKINFRLFDNGAVGISLDETTEEIHLKQILQALGAPETLPSLDETTSLISGDLRRKKPFLTHSVFHKYHSETEMLRYIRRLESKDLSLTSSMIPLGSCTMKLNASSEMYPVGWQEFSAIHPFAPPAQTEGYHILFRQLEDWLSEITGFDAVSLQPNSGAQGEYAGLLVIRKFHRDRGDANRNICLIPRSAHGTNPASAIMTGMTVIAIECDTAGNIDLADLRKKATLHAANLSALMVTYPSTHGVFEESIQEICQMVHSHGGQVYMDGANMNAQVGLCRPGDFGPDVCHLNLHKTFCIPHGGGGPGMGPIAVKKHLAPYLPGHPLFKTGGDKAIGPVSAAPWGSASILAISWMYIRMMGTDGLTRATQTAILNANYIAHRLHSSFPILYRGISGLVAHECIIDLRHLKKMADIEVEDISKRLMDYGFHAPTVSWPVAGTMMIEPTESESLIEIDRFCDAMNAIYQEVELIANGKWDRIHNPLKNSPHTQNDLMKRPWPYWYSAELAFFPSDFVKKRKFWPAVSRIDNVWGDRNLFCSCPPVE